MKIADINKLDLNNTYFKIGKTSITVKDLNNKTIGVITGVNTWNNMQFNQKVDWNIKFHKMGINGLDIVNKLIFVNNEMYFFHDKSFYNEMQEDKDFYADDINKLNNQLALCNSAGITTYKVILY